MYDDYDVQRRRTTYNVLRRTITYVRERTMYDDARRRTTTMVIVMMMMVVVVVTQKFSS